MKDTILSPQSIAIVGASTNKKKIGTVLLNNLIKGDYKGKIYPINPKYKEISSKETYPDILSIKEKIDLVCIAIPAQFVEDIVDQCIKKKVSTVVIISAGFKETGSAGKELEDKIAQKLKEAGIRLIGPNCLGFINNSANINLTFARNNPGKGDIAFISQSGAFCTAILDMACKYNIGFSKVISIGNKADISENELVEYLQKDEDTESIAIYLEEFRDGKEFVNIAQKAKKPMVIIAPGSSEKAQKAITSHTGSLASSYDTTVAAINKGNLIKVESSEELFDTITILSNKKLPVGKRVAVVTNAGGPGIIATDNIERFGLEVANLEEKTVEKLKNKLPLESNIHNPIDMLGDALNDRYEFSISNVIEDNNVDSILVILTPQLTTEIAESAKTIIRLQKQTSKPIFACFLGGKEIESGVRLLVQEGMYVSNNIEDTVRLISKVTMYGIKSKSKEIRDIKTLKKKAYNRKDLEDLLTEEVTVLDDEVTMNILKEFKIDTPKQLITANIEEAIEFAALNFPVAIKATSKDIAHKTDFKGLFLDIRTLSELQSKFEQLVENIEKATGKNSPDILIQEMLKPKAEFFIGANRQGGTDIYEGEGLGFGHLMAIGQGGIYTEVYKDIKHILVPETQNNIERILNSTNIVKIIDGYRGKAPLAKEKLLTMIDQLQSMLVTYPQIVSMDINPVILTENRAIAVDVKIYIRR
jgi:acetyltransferase